MKKTALVLLICVGLVWSRPVAAEYNFKLPNNKFGIHLAQPHDEEIKAAAQLVNSNGGDWGYVTLVIQENDRSLQKWQEIFDQLRDYHLIPIVRLATAPEGEVWRRPKPEDAQAWADFLGRLNWVVKNRYVILFNEPNHGQEWGGATDASNYARVAASFIGALKKTSPDFFVMLAGLDLSAPASPPNHEDAATFLQGMVDSHLIDLNRVDGLASHSYPNPAFSGSPWDSGRRTIRGYQWELEYWRELGRGNDPPVFISETGWDGDRLNRSVVADDYQQAFVSVWDKDSRVVAVTPFVLDYQGPPFLGFSWKLPSGYGDEQHRYYPQYYAVQAIAKVRGEPEIVEKGTLSFSFPAALVTDSVYNFSVKVKNLGEGIWDKDQRYYLSLAGYPESLYSFSDLINLKPNQETLVNLYLKTSGLMKQQRVEFFLSRSGKKITSSQTWKFDVMGMPSIAYRVGLFPKLATNASDFELQIFDQEERLVYKRQGLTVKNGSGKTDRIQNIILGEKYRLVILKPYYLPRQTLVALKKDKNEIKFRPMLPLDFDQDGRLTVNDLLTLVRSPGLLMYLLP
ncbi:hypothetical protein M1523_03205 [Patescibacteria group bacterium]|nr:hypothetical protein [Patescibacteria group bacterium]MCL5091271.1 hypothetical protein [Patescibacteria group bacterium]